MDYKEIFVQEICSYLLMSDEEIGRNISVLPKDGKSIASFTGSNGALTQSVEIKPNPVVRPRCLVNRDTICFETWNKSSMTEYLWSKSEDNAEVRFMKDALPVPGVVKYITSLFVHQTNSHLGSFNISCAKLWDLKAEDNTKSRGSYYHELNLPSLKRNCFLFRIVMTSCSRKIDSSGSILA